MNPKCFASIAGENTDLHLGEHCALNPDTECSVLLENTRCQKGKGISKRPGGYIDILDSPFP